MSGDKSSMDAISTASFTPALRRQDTGAREVMVQLTRSNTAGSISSEDAEAEELRELMHGSNLSMLSDHQWDLLLKEEAGAQRLDKLRQALTAATSSVIAPPRLGTEFLRLRRRLALHAAMTRLNRAARVIQRHYRGKRTREMTARRHRQLAEWNVQSAEKWWQRSNLIPQTLPLSFSHILRYNIGDQKTETVVSAEENLWSEARPKPDPVEWIRALQSTTDIMPPPQSELHEEVDSGRGDDDDAKDETEAQRVSVTKNWAEELMRSCDEYTDSNEESESGNMMDSVLDVRMEDRIKAPPPDSCPQRQENKWLGGNKGPGARSRLRMDVRASGDPLLDYPFS